MDFRKFKRIMSYCKQYGGATLDGFGRVVKFDSGYQVAYTDHAVKGRKRGYLYDIYAYMSYMTDFELQYKGLDFFKLIDVIRNDYELEDTLIKEVIEFTKY